MSHQTVVTAKSSDLPVTLAQAKDHVRFIGGEHDEYITTLIEAATEYCETIVSRPLRVSHTVAQTYCEWPGSIVRFDRQPVKSIESVAYYDADDAAQTVLAANYRLRKSTEAGSILEFDGDFLSPALATRGDALTITYLAGYADIASVPARAKHAIKLLIGHWFAHGEAVNIGNITTEVPMATSALLSSLDWGSYR